MKRNMKTRHTRLFLAVALLLGCGALASLHVPSLEEHYQAARAALAKGDTVAATRELRLSLQHNPLHAPSHFLLAELLGRAGEMDQAIVGFQKTAALEPNNATARFNLGTALLWRGEPTLAATSLEASVALRPDYVPAYNNLGKAYFLAGLPELALASFEEALRRDPTNLIALNNRRRLAAAAENHSAAAGARAAPVVPPGPANVVRPPASADDPEADALRELLRDLPHVTVERRGGRLTLNGWTSGKQERAMLDKIIGQPSPATGAKAPASNGVPSNFLDLTSDDIGDPHRLLEVDATIFTVRGVDSQSAGHNFLNRITVDASINDAASAGFSWLYSASISYVVNIANATEERVAFLARPHLTTLSGTPATFIAGGDVVYKVSGTTSGDIKPYPFGTALNVTPTLLRTPGEDGSPRIRLVVKVGRRSILPITSPNSEAAGGSTVFDNTEVTSEAILALNQTLILSGLSQRESATSRTGVPGLKSIPIVKYLFSEKVVVNSDLALIMLLTPRDPAFQDERNIKATAEFVEKRRAFLRARQGTPEDMQRFRERYPDWMQIAPNRFASHLYMMETSEVYRALSGEDFLTDGLDLELLGPTPKKWKDSKE
jgi:tetratricopeptide (TPR) repeat protein